MNCHEASLLLEASVDGELDLVRQLDLEAHLTSCPECARRGEALRARRAALRESLPRFAAPPHLSSRVRAALRAEGAVPQAGPTPARRMVPASWLNWSVTGLAASVALALSVGYAWGNARSRDHQLIDDAVANHIRSLQFNHLSDVVSTDQHTVKPWFAGKLDFSPPVVDLAAVGFPLAGGRLERLAGHPAAALVFRRREHAINLFIWPVAGEAVAPRQSELNGYHTQSWTQGGFNFEAVSEIPVTDLNQFAAAFQAANPG